MGIYYLNLIYIFLHVSSHLVFSGVFWLLLLLFCFGLGALLRLLLFFCSFPYGLHLVSKGDIVIYKKSTGSDKGIPKPL